MLDNAVSFQLSSCCQLLGMSVTTIRMAVLGITNIESWRQVIFSLSVYSGQNCSLQYLVGEMDILSMTELIKRPGALPLPGVWKFQRMGWGWGRIMGMLCGEARRMEGTSSKCVFCAQQSTCVG